MPARFELPDNGSADFRGNWYAFTVGPIRVISLNKDDQFVMRKSLSKDRDLQRLAAARSAR